MKKKFVVALATSLVLANGTSAAFAAKVTDSDDSGSSTSVAARPGNAKLTPAQRSAQLVTRARHDQDVISFKAELRAYLVKRAAIEKSFKTAVANARKAFNVALKSATTNVARKAARDSFLTAGKIARQTYQDALKSLGAPPAKPEKPEDSK